MTDYPNIPAAPSSGYIRYFDSIRPPLKQGDYEIQLAQNFSERGEGDAPDTTLMSDQFAKQYFTVQGSQWSIDPLTIHARYPPKNQQGVLLDNTLPKIVFQNKSLPWERSISGSVTNPNTPWLALLMFTEDEFTKGCRILEEQDTFSMPSSGVAVNTPMDIRVLSVDQTLLRNIAPTVEDLPYLAHALQVDTKDKELCGSDEDGIFSVILGNRVPTKTDTAYHVCLVSLEGHQDNLPSMEDANVGPKYVPAVKGVGKGVGKGEMLIMKPIYSYNASSATSFVLLDRWSFRTGDGGDFESRMKALQFRRSIEDSERVGALGSMSDHATPVDSGLRYEPALLGSDMDPDVTINSFVQTEITEHDGLSRQCLYRGPAVAVPVEHEPKLEPYVNSDDARGIESDLDMDVIHHSAAFELGRLLALSDPKFIQTLGRWRHERLHRKSQLLKIEKLGELNPNLVPSIDDMNIDIKMQDLIQKDIITQVSEKFQTSPVVDEFDGTPGTRTNPRTETDVIEIIDIMIEENLEIFDAEFADQQLLIPEAEHLQRFGVG